MDFIGPIYIGLVTAFQPVNILYCFIGVLIGTLIGVLPGIGPAGAIAILFPTTYNISPVSAIIMLSGIYYGAMYGGSTTSILVNIPGEAASVVTCIDGYQMARQGRAGAALGIAAFGSFIAGLFGIICLTFLAPSLANIALDFGPPEYFSLMILGMTLVTYLSSGSMTKALMMAVFGIVLGCVGQDPIFGKPRLTYGIEALWGGIGFVPVVMGLFGISEVLINIESGKEKQEIYDTKIKGLLPNRTDWRKSLKPIAGARCSDFLLGIFPGGVGLLLHLFLIPSRRNFPNTQKFRKREQSREWLVRRLQIILQHWEHDSPFNAWNSIQCSDGHVLVGIDNPRYASGPSSYSESPGTLLGCHHQHGLR